MNTLVFDIETVPDVEFGRRRYGLEGLAAGQIAKAMFALRRQQAGSEFLPPEQQRVVAISCALRSGDTFKVWSLGDLTSSESELIQRFFTGIENLSPNLVSWNGSGFDLPVLTYRAMLAGLQAKRFWEMGDSDDAFRFNNYLNRYHWRHTDLMDVLSGFHPRNRVSLASMASLLGLPGTRRSSLGYAAAWLPRRSRISPSSCAPGRAAALEHGDFRSPKRARRERGGDRTGGRAHARRRRRGARWQDRVHRRSVARRAHPLPPHAAAPPAR